MIDDGTNAPGRVRSERADEGGGDRAGPNMRGSRSPLAASVVILALLAALAGGLWWMGRDADPVTLTVAAGPWGSDSYALMREAAAVMERHSDEVRLSVRATRGSSRNMALLNAGRVDLATVTADTPMAASVRTVSDLFADYFQLIAAPGAPIRSVTDLEGALVAIPPHGTRENRAFHMLLDHYDVATDLVRFRAMPFASARRRLLAGSVDALFTVRSLRDDALIGLFEDAGLTGKRLRIVPITQAAAIAVKRPFIRPAAIPQGTYTGRNPTPSGDAETAALTRALVTRTDVAEEAVRELARVLYGHRQEIANRFSLAASIARPGDLGGVPAAPAHDGAQAWFDRFEPSFLQENAEPLALVVTVFSLMLSALFALRSRVSSVRKNRLDAYNHDLLAIGERARCASAGEIEGLRERHFAILANVVHALDTDEVTEEGFNSFSLLWESVRAIVDERRTELRRTARDSARDSARDAARGAARGKAA